MWLQHLGASTTDVRTGYGPPDSSTVIQGAILGEVDSFCEEETRDLLLCHFIKKSPGPIIHCLLIVYSLKIDNVNKSIWFFMKHKVDG